MDKYGVQKYIEKNIKKILERYKKSLNADIGTADLKEIYELSTEIEFIKACEEIDFEGFWIAIPEKPVNQEDIPN